MVKALDVVVLALVVFGGTLGVLATLFRVQVRRFNRRAASDLLDDWAARLELLEPHQRALVVPPANVLAAMAALPAPGWRSSWTDRPATSFDVVASAGGTRAR